MFDYMIDLLIKVRLILSQMYAMLPITPLMMYMDL
jgi:hypothetical protein